MQYNRTNDCYKLDRFYFNFPKYSIITDLDEMQLTYFDYNMTYSKKYKKYVSMEINSTKDCSRLKNFNIFYNKKNSLRLEIKLDGNGELC